MSAKHATETREVVTCRIRPDLIRQLDALGLTERRSRSELIEMSVEMYLLKRPSKAKAGK